MTSNKILLAFALLAFGAACGDSKKPPTHPAPACGDGTLDEGEKCDDGNSKAHDGCSSTCTIEAGYACTGSPSVCTAHCGDGIVAGTERCDDGNTAAGDGCSTDCQVEAGWACNSSSPSACNTTCGDGKIAGA